MVPKIYRPDLYFEFQNFFSTSLLGMLWVCPAFRVDILRNKHVAIPSPSSHPILLPPAQHSHSESGVKLPVTCSLCLQGCFTCPLQAAVAFCPWRRPRCIVLCIWKEKFAQEAGGKPYACRRWHLSLLESAGPPFAPKGRIMYLLGTCHLCKALD